MFNFICFIFAIGFLLYLLLHIIAFLVVVLPICFKHVRWYFRVLCAALKKDTENKYYKEFKEYVRYLKVYNTLGRRPKPHRSL